MENYPDGKDRAMDRTNTESLKDLLTSLLWLGFAFIFGMAAYRIRLFSLDGPGPGFFPFLCALSLGALSLILCVTMVFKMAVRRTTGESEKHLSEKVYPKRVLIVLSALIFYMLGIEFLGFLLTTLIFMILLLRISGGAWKVTLAVAILSALSAFLVFKILLKVPLPGGWLGI